VLVWKVRYSGRLESFWRDLPRCQILEIFENLDELFDSTGLQVLFDDDVIALGVSFLTRDIILDK